MKSQISNLKSQISFIFIFSLFFLLFLLTFARPACAAQQRNDTAIFTGQVIPAYIGGAYDPTEGFKKLAGLPIYVFAYDSWQGTNFVIHNFAVRTQIRADGSFQAQGLPTAAHYGVYFPFEGVDDNGDGTFDRVKRTDNLVSSPAPQTAEFRWPVENDQIRDVFSYTVGNAGEAIQIVDQFGKPITLGQAFLTNERKLDIENTINVFPLVPHRALRITVPVSSTLEQGISYEVYAQRVTKKIDRSANQPQGLGVVNSPVIRGRTNTGTQSGPFTYGVFQAYAPDGFYAITIWRTEGGSVSYKDWNGTDPVNSTNTGLGFLYVDKDWQQQITRSGDETDVAHRDHLISVWGLVTDERGFPMSTLNRGPQLQLQDIDIGIKTDTDLVYARKNDPERDVGDELRTGDFYTGWGGRDLPDRTVYGIYAFYQYFSDTAIPTPLNEHNWVYIETQGYKENPTPPPGIIKGTDGPVRIDLTASTSSLPDRPLGYDTGLHIDILDANGGFFDPPLSYATARIIPIKEKKGFYIPAAFQIYSADRLGWIHIPDNDLAREQGYLVEVRAGSYLGYKQVTYPAGGYKEVDVRVKNMALAIRTTYKILGIIPVPWLSAQAAGEKGVIKGTLMLSRGAQLLGPSWYIDEITSKGPGRCVKPRCEVIPDDLTQAMPAGGSFEVHLPWAPTPEEAAAECRAEASACVPGVDEDCFPDAITLCDKLQSSSVITDTYILHIEGTIKEPDRDRVLSAEQTLTIDSNGLTSPPFLMTLEIDCNKTFPVGLDILNLGESFATSLANIPNRSACNFGQFFISKSTALFDAFQKHALQTRPLTKEQGIVAIWNIMRNFTNVFFIIFLLAIGITTILRYEPKTWSPGSLIPKLLLAIVLANFSLLLVQLFIDISNILTQAIFNLTQGVLTSVVPEGGGRILLSAGTGSGVVGAALVGSLAIWISHMGVGLLGAVASAAATGGLSLVPILITGIGIFLSILLFILGLILLYFIRYFAIWICTILAPLIFAIGVFPSKITSSFSEMWWNTLLPFIIMQPVTAFVLSIGLMLLTVGGGEGSLFGGFGVAIMGLITLFFSIKIPSIVGSMFKGGLIKGEGLGMAPEGLAKQKETFMKDTMTAEKLGAAVGQERRAGKGGLRAALSGAAGLFRGKYAEEEAKAEAGKAYLESATGKTGAEKAERDRKKAERIVGLNRQWAGQGSDHRISRAHYEAFDDYLSDAPSGSMVNIRGMNASAKSTLHAGLTQKYGGDAAAHARASNELGTGQIRAQDFAGIFSGDKRTEGIGYIHEMGDKNADHTAQSSFRENLTNALKHKHATKTD